jgi:hypothetical protein
MKELWEEQKILDKLAKTAKEGDLHMGDSGYWKFQNGRWVTQWVLVQGRMIKGEQYEKEDQEDLVGYDLHIEKGNYE